MNKAALRPATGTVSRLEVFPAQRPPVSWGVSDVGQLNEWCAARLFRVSPNTSDMGPVTGHSNYHRNPKTRSARRLDSQRNSTNTGKALPDASPVQFDIQTKSRLDR